MIVRPEYLMARRATVRIRRTSAWFAFGLALMIALMVAFYPTVRDRSDDLAEAYEGMPEGLLEAFGIGDSLDLSAYSSFMNAEILGLIFPITAGVFAIMQGAATVAKEIETGTASLWLSAPAERWQLLAGKVAALVLGSTLIAGITAMVTGIGSIIVGGDLTAGSVLSIFVVLLGYMVAVGGIAVASSSVTNDRGRAGALAAAIVIGSYMLKIIASLSATFDWLRYLSIFTAYQSLPALQEGAVPVATAILYVVGAVSAGLGLVFFQKRDIVI